MQILSTVVRRILILHGQPDSKGGAAPRSEVRALLHPQQLDLEDQGGVRRNYAARPAGTVAEVGGDGELPLAADLHAGDAFVPAADDLPAAEVEAEGALAVMAGVELGAVLQPAGVVDVDGLAGFGLRSLANFEVGVLEAGRCGDCMCGVCHGSLLSFKLASLSHCQQLELVDEDRVGGDDAAYPLFAEA